MATDVTLPAAAAAGLLSFLSPCVLPLVPPYLTFIAGTTIEDVAYERVGRARRDIFLAAVLFVLGFSTVFVALGATASVFGQVIRQHIQFLSVLAGLAIILMGLHFLGVFRLSILYREKRRRGRKAARSLGRLCSGACFRFRLDALHRAHSRGDPRCRGIRTDSRTRRLSARRLFARPRHSVFDRGPCDRTLHRIPETISRPFPDRRTRRRRSSHCDGHRIFDRHDADRLLLAAADFSGPFDSRLNVRLSETADKNRLFRRRPFSRRRCCNRLE